MEIAQTIVEQINYADRSTLGLVRNQFFSAISECKEFQGGLAFQVQMA
jgi:hypothetical protein